MSGCCLQLAERDLQVVLLKSFISNMGSPSELEHFQEVCLPQQPRQTWLHRSAASMQQG
jgi:hypothetical protein